MNKLNGHTASRSSEDLIPNEGECGSQESLDASTIILTISGVLVLIFCGLVLTPSVLHQSTDSLVQPNPQVESGKLVDFGYDQARDFVKGMTLEACGLVLAWPLDEKKQNRIGALMLDGSLRVFIPIFVRILGCFAINDFGSVGGGLPN